MDRNQIKVRLFFWYAILWITLIVSMYVSFFVYFTDTQSTISKWIGLVAGGVAALLATCKLNEILFKNNRNATIKRIATYFFEGTNIYSFKQNATMFVIGIIISYFILKFLSLGYLICFLLGVFLTKSVLYCINFVTARTSAGISYSNGNESFNSIYKLAHNSGIATSATIAVCVIAPLAIMFHIFKDYQIISAFVLGSAFCGLYSTIGASIVKVACKKANTTLKMFFEGIEENDKRNPLLLLNGITKVIFPISSLSCEFLISSTLILISAMTIGAECMHLMGQFLPIVIFSGGIFASIIVVLLTKVSKEKNQIKTLLASAFNSIILFNIFTFFEIKYWLPDYTCLTNSIICGSFCGYLVCFLAIRNIFKKFKPVQNISNAATIGNSSAIIQSLKEGFNSTFLPIIIIAFTIIASFLLAEGVSAPLLGIYGIVLSVLGLIATFGTMVSINAFSLITANTDNVSKTYDEEYSTISDEKRRYLKQLGYELYAIGKNYNNISTVLASICAIIAYTIAVGVVEVDILNPYVLGSLVVGTALPFLYCAMILGAVSKSTSRLIFEVKKQFRKYPQILRYEMRPDYENCVEYAAKNSSIQVSFYTTIIVAIVILVACFLKIEAVAGLAIGSILSANIAIFVLTNSSFATKSAKKYFKEEFQNAFSMGEYDILSTTNSIYQTLYEILIPSLSVLIKFITILLLIFAPFLAQL